MTEEIINYAFKQLNRLKNAYKNILKRMLNELCDLLDDWADNVIGTDNHDLKTFYNRVKKIFDESIITYNDILIVDEED